MTADGYTPLTASDAALSLYADYYYEYSDDRYVTKETVMSGSQTFEFAYETSTFSDDVNHWQMKTTETLPDSNQNIVYSNHAGQQMLKVFQSGGDQWIEFWRYDANANITLHAHPSSVTGFDEMYADLLNFDSGLGTYEYLRDSAGLIETNTFDPASGYLASESIQEGQLGTPILRRSMTYCQSRRPHFASDITTPRIRKREPCRTPARRPKHASHTAPPGRMSSAVL